MATKDAGGDVALPFLSIGEMKPSGQTASFLAIISLTVASLTVGLRFFTRISRKFSLDGGDVWLMVGLCLFGGYCFFLIRGIQTSGGTLDKDEFTIAGVRNFYKYLFAVEAIFPSVITAIKISLLLLYTSIFPTHKFRRNARIVMGICVLWGILFTFLIVGQCTPVHAFWDESFAVSGKARCIQFGSILVALEATNIAIDVLILSLPLMVIKNLQLPRARKNAYACLFGLGSLITIVCMMRIYYLASINNTTAPNVMADGLNSSTAELGVAVVCASVPTYGPYFNKVAQGYSWLSSRLSLGSWGTTIWSRICRRQGKPKRSLSLDVGKEHDDRKSSLKPHSIYMPHYPPAKVQEAGADQHTNPSVDTDISTAQGSHFTAESEVTCSDPHDSRV